MAPTNPFTGATSFGAAGNGGRGGGGGGHKGLYKGKKGTAASNQDPLTFFNTALRRSGALGSGGGSGSDFTTWLTGTFAPGMVTDYNAALGRNEHLGAKQWLHKQYGVGGWNGNFRGGQFKDITHGPLYQKFDTWFANKNPQTRIATEAVRRGLMPSNGNDQFTQWYLTQYAPQIEANWRSMAQKNPELSFANYARDLDPNDARKAYAYRAPVARWPTAASPGGSWSWWK